MAFVEANDVDRCDYCSIYERSILNIIGQRYFAVSHLSSALVVKLLPESSQSLG